MSKVSNFLSMEHALTALPRGAPRLTLEQMTHGKKSFSTERVLESHSASSCLGSFTSVSVISYHVMLELRTLLIIEIA